MDENRFDYQQQLMEEEAEASFHFALAEFSQLVTKFGIKYVISNLPKETEEVLYWHYFQQLKRE